MSTVRPTRSVFTSTTIPRVLGKLLANGPDSCAAVGYRFTNEKKRSSLTGNTVGFQLKRSRQVIRKQRRPNKLFVQMAPFFSKTLNTRFLILTFLETQLHTVYTKYTFT